MNLLERSLIEKAGYANGWENVRENTTERMIMFSARHKAEAQVTPAATPGTAWWVAFPYGPPIKELCHSLPEMLDADGYFFQALGEASLGKLLRRAAELAMSLPNKPADLFAEEVAKIEAQPPTTTEALRIVKQRIGQNLFRQALMEYWGGACAVNGLALPEALRASHAKPWAKCDTDGERLDVFNGFLLSANLDALFDAGLVTFTNEGLLVSSDKLTQEHHAILGFAAHPPPRLRWISPQHLPYLAWHRQFVFRD